MIDLKEKLKRCKHCPYLYEDDYCLCCGEYLEDMNKLHCGISLE